MTKELHDAHVNRMNERDTAQFESAFHESVANGKAISWRYWVHQMPSLTAAQFARLSRGLDPVLFETLSARPNKNDPSDLCAQARLIEQLAIAEGKTTAPANEWLNWADEREFRIHPAFRLETNDKFQSRPFNAPAQNTATPAPMVTASASGDDESWKAKARGRAYEIIKRDRDRSLYPSQINLADEIAKEFRRDGVTGADGKPLAGAYIKRHALSGISSAQSKLVSTVMLRGK